MKRIFILVLTILFLISGHLMDIGNIAKKTTNGFINVDGVRLYHAGLYMMYVCFLVLAILSMKEN